MKTNNVKKGASHMQRIARHSNRTRNKLFNEEWVKSNARNHQKNGLSKGQFLKDMSFTGIDPTVISYIWDTTTI